MPGVHHDDIQSTERVGHEQGAGYFETRECMSAMRLKDRYKTNQIEHITTDDLQPKQYENAP